MLILYTKGTCNKIIQKPNNFPVKHRRTDKFLNYLSHKNSFLFALHIINISKWAVSAQFTFITMLRSWLFSRFCFAKRHQTKQSRCMFSRFWLNVSYNGMLQKKISRKRNTGNCSSFLCSWWRTRQENSSLTLANMVQRNKPNSTELFVP